jgi:hypothetical protein
VALVERTQMELLELQAATLSLQALHQQVVGLELVLAQAV